MEGHVNQQQRWQCTLLWLWLTDECPHVLEPAYEVAVILYIKPSLKKREELLIYAAGFNVKMQCITNFLIQLSAHSKQRYQYKVLCNTHQICFVILWQYQQPRICIMSTKHTTTTSTRFSQSKVKDSQTGQRRITHWGQHYFFYALHIAQKELICPQIIYGIGSFTNWLVNRPGQPKPEESCLWQLNICSISINCYIRHNE